MKFMPQRGVTTLGRGKRRDRGPGGRGQHLHLWHAQPRGRAPVRRGAYDRQAYYRKPGIKLLVDFITNPASGGYGNEERLRRLHDDMAHKDWFMVFSDLEEYIQVKERVYA